MDQGFDTPSSGQKMPSLEEQDLVSGLIADFDYLFGLRGNWNSHWTEIAQRIVPDHAYLFENYSQLGAHGDKRNFEVYDSTGINALQKFAAILDSLLTPRNQIWHNLAPDDDRLRKDKDTMLWFEQANKILFHERYSPHSNFSGQNQGVYLSLGAYGTGSLFIDELAGNPGIRYKNVHLGELFLQENHQGIVDAVCRHFQMTARQAVQKFKEKCPEIIQKAYEKTPDQRFFFLHWVRPRTDRDPLRKDYKGMPYASYYVSIEGRALCGEGGYRTFPYAIPRYRQAPNEAYGRSPAMDVLPSIKTLNEQKKTMLKQGHRIVDPVLLAHDDGVLDSFSLEPGSVNAGGVSADGRLLVQALPTGNIAAGKEFMDEEKTLINDTFLVTLFQILIETPEMTATEVMERTREKGILLAPTVGRQQSEYLGPMVDRELDILSRQGRLPQMPRFLREAKGQYKIVYDSPITRTQKAEQASGAMRTFEMLTQVAQQTGDPSVMDYINWDMAVPQIADIYSVPPSWIKSSDDIQKIREQRAHQQAVQQTLQAAPALAAMSKQLGPGGGAPQASAPGQAPSSPLSVLPKGPGKQR